jgi:SET domain-containing protein 6
VSTIVENHPDLAGENMDAKIDWWLEVGGDEYASNTFTFLFDYLTIVNFYSVFVLELDLEIPPDFTSFIRLIKLKPEWEKAQNKNKPPKPKLDSQALSIIRNVLVNRLAQYPTTLKVSLSQPVLRARHFF